MSGEYFSSERLSLHLGDSLTAAKNIETGSISCIVTSPPYYGLRDYGNDGQLGAEESPAEYVANLVDLFSELRRSLADDGTLWLNLGDSYAGSLGKRNGGIASKNLMGMPWRVAFGLQDDGWILRSEIIWHKPNAMPESVTDRPTKSHETVFLFSKSAKYFYDADAVKEEAVSSHPAGNKKHKYADAYVQESVSGNQQHRTKAGLLALSGVKWKKRNRRTVWTVPTAPFAEAHFAVYPPELIRPCILAGSRPGGVVLDPFSGSGTTGMVALEEGRNYIGVDLNSDYLDLSLRTRLAGYIEMEQAA